MATGDDDEDRRQLTMMTTTKMATARWVTKLTMMATMTTLVTGDDNDGATGDVVAG